MICFLDDIAIAEAINEIEMELNEDRRSFFDPNSALDVDLGEIDDKLKQVAPSDGDFEAQGKIDATSAEGSHFFTKIRGVFTFLCYQLMFCIPILR